MNEKILNMRRLPGRLDVNQTAALLGFQRHDVTILVSARHLQPLGKPSPNSVKYFSSAEIIELANNRQWLDKATKLIANHWKERDKRPPGNLAKVGVSGGMSRDHEN